MPKIKKCLIRWLATLNNIGKSTRTRFLYFGYFPGHRTKSLCFMKSKSVFSLNFRKFYSTMGSFSTVGLYRNLETILDELTDYQHNGVEAVQELLKVFNASKKKFEERDGNKNKNYPLIVLEGLDGSGKSAMTRQLASRIHAEKWQTPPESIRFLRQFFDDHSSLRTAYYSLGNYIAALEVSCILNKKPVVMDRFWHSTAAYTLAQGVADSSYKLALPHSQNDIYKWPSDLLKPDIVLLLNVSEDVRLERHSRRNAATVTAQEELLKSDAKFRELVLEAYKNSREPGVVLVDGNGSIECTLYLLMEKMRPLVVGLNLESCDTGYNPYVPPDLRNKKQGNDKESAVPESGSHDKDDDRIESKSSTSN